MVELDLASGAFRDLHEGRSPWRSPDGSTLYSQIDLLRRGTGGGAPTTVVASSFSDPCYGEFLAIQATADGARVAWQSVGEIVCVASVADGALIGRVDHATAPAFRADGRLVYAGGTGFEGIYVASADLATSERIDPAMGAPQEPAVSPDGATILVVEDGAVYAFSPGGPPATRLTPNASFSAPRWSPDGTRWVVHTETGGLMVVETTTGTSTELTELRDHIFGVNPGGAQWLR